MSARPRPLLAALTLPLAVMALAVEPGGGFPLRNAEAGRKAPPFSLKATRPGKPLVVCYYRRGQRFSKSALETLAGLSGRFAEVPFVAVRSAEDDGDAFSVERSTGLVFAEDAERALYGSWGLFILPTTVVLDGDARIQAAFASDPGDLADGVAAALEDALGIPRRAAPPVSTAASAPPGVGLARNLLEEGRAKEALALLSPALTAADAGCAPRLLAGRAHLLLGAPAEAKREAEACLALEPRSPAAALVAGLAEEALGDLAAAEARLKYAASLQPDSVEARYHLGGIYERSGRKDEALAEYRAALKRRLRD